MLKFIWKWNGLRRCKYNKYRYKIYRHISAPKCRWKYLKYCMSRRWHFVLTWSVFDVCVSVELEYVSTQIWVCIKCFFKLFFLTFIPSLLQNRSICQFQNYLHDLQQIGGIQTKELSGAESLLTWKVRFYGGVDCQHVILKVRVTWVTQPEKLQYGMLSCEW